MRLTVRFNISNSVWPIRDRITYDIRIFHFRGFMEYFGDRHLFIHIDYFIWFVSNIHRRDKRYFHVHFAKHTAGRVYRESFSFIASLTSIAAPFGSLLGGFTASLIGSDKVFFIGGIAMLFVSVYWVFQSSLRSIPSSERINAKEYSFLQTL